MRRRQSATTELERTVDDGGKSTASAMSPGKGARRQRSTAQIERRAAWVFLAPWLIGLVVITAGPMIASLYLSFTDYPMLVGPTWVGLDNFRELVSDPKYLNAVGVTLRYVFVSVPLQLTFALMLALALNRGLRGLSIYRGVFYLPSLLASSVAIAILWRQVFGRDGLVNGFLDNFGIDGPSWIGNPQFALSTLIVLNVWTFGSPMIIFLAGLRQIPKMYYEAAAIDGAGAIGQFFRITLPLLTPIIFFNLVLQIIHAFQAFTPAYIVSGGTGGPVDSTMFYTLYLYQQGFTQFRMGYAAAMAWFLLVTIAVFTALNFFTSKYWVFYGDGR